MTCKPNLFRQGALVHTRPSLGHYLPMHQEQLLLSAMLHQWWTHLMLHRHCGVRMLGSMDILVAELHQTLVWSSQMENIRLTQSKLPIANADMLTNNQLKVSCSRGLKHYQLVQLGTSYLEHEYDGVPKTPPARVQQLLSSSAYQSAMRDCLRPSLLYKGSPAMAFYLSRAVLHHVRWIACRFRSP